MTDPPAHVLGTMAACLHVQLTAGWWWVETSSAPWLCQSGCKRVKQPPASLTHTSIILALHQWLHAMQLPRA